MSKLPRPEHIPQGEPCERCGLPAARHRKRPPRTKPHRAVNPARLSAPTPRKKKKTGSRGRTSFLDHPLIGFDGEGQNTKSGRHLYTYASAVNEDGEKLGSVGNISGLSTDDMLEFLTSLPEIAFPLRNSPHLTMFGFSLGYDLTKILEDLPDRDLWMLNRPEARSYTIRNPVDETARKHVFRSIVQYVGPRTGNVYELDYQRSRFMVRRVDDVIHSVGKNGRPKKRPIGPSVTLWDGFSFFACSFVSALEKWNVGTPEQREQILGMKLQRGDFASLQHLAIQRYCDDECALLGQLMRKLIDAHRKADIPLRDYYGAGSSGSAMLRKWNAKDWLGPLDEKMRMAVARAYAAGRFEASRVGPIRETVYAFDISSAYPYAMACGMPCLAHGRWNHVKLRGRDTNRLHTRIRKAPYALVHCRAQTIGKNPAWGPFPWRQSDGNIVYPLSTPSSWIWRAEYLAAHEGHPWRVRPREAWLYETECECKPFRNVPHVYAERVKLGKDAEGLVLKLGLNSTYGKTAQSVGSHPFQSWIWAGMITSNTRAQLLGAIASASDPWAVLMTATDGIFALEDLKLPTPQATGTFNLQNQKGEYVPLGGWERKAYPKGMFIARPGVYFPLGHDNDEGDEKVRARGVGRRTLAAHRKAIVEHFEKQSKSRYRPYPESYCFDAVNLFVGMKTGVLRHPVGPRPKPGKPIVLGEPVRSDDYGRWIEREQELSFAPQPKRETVLKLHRLQPWGKAVDKRGKAEKQSMPYGPALGEEAILSEEASRMIGQREVSYEQPHPEWGLSADIID